MLCLGNLTAGGSGKTPAALALIAAGIVLGFTRGVWLATGVAALFLLWRRRRLLVLALPVAAGLALWLGPESLRDRALSFVAPHGERDSNSHREICWKSGVRMVSAHPWVGAGPELVGSDLLNHLPHDVLPPLPEGYYAHLHNIYLQYPAERGLPALAALLWLLGKVLWDFFRAIPVLSGFRRATVLGSIAAVLAILAGGMFEYNLGDSEVLTMFCSIIALGYAAMHPHDGEPAHA